MVPLPPSLRQWYHTLQQNWPTSFKQYKRFYALGIDAYQLSQQWAALTTFSGFELEGASGRLSLTADQHVHRNLRWARIKANRAYMLDR
jgi:outer membrane PBP1 activator LpoA protein